MIGLVPLDVKVCEPVLKRAQAAGIKVITHEGPEQEGRDWNVELIDSVRFGEVQMQRLAKDMGEAGDYVVYVGTLTTPLHNKWADAAIAYQKAHYPKMKLVADRFPGADEIDTAYKTTLDVIKAYPNLKGILGFGSNGPIGAGNAVREKRLGKKIAVVGTVLPSQAKDLIADGIIREGFLWNPTDAGYAMVAVARLVLDGKPDQGRRRDPGPRQGDRRRSRQADQGRQDHAHQQRDDRRLIAGASDRPGGRIRAPSPGCRPFGRSTVLDGAFLELATSPSISAASSRCATSTSSWRRARSIAWSVKTARASRR